MKNTGGVWKAEGNKILSHKIPYKPFYIKFIHRNSVCLRWLKLNLSKIAPLFDCIPMWGYGMFYILSICCLTRSVLIILFSYLV